jgi:hypothetical protein
MGDVILGGARVNSSTPLAVSAAPAASTTGTTTSVNDQATSVTLLAANPARKGATIYNDSPGLLYVKLGATASVTDFTALLLGNGSGVGGYYEVPAGYTGIIDGIWSADASGAARITERT